MTFKDELNLVLLAGSLVSRHDDLATSFIKYLQQSAVKREQIREAILQTYLFDGYPTALEGMILLNKIWPHEAEPVESPEFSNWREWAQRGENLYKRIYGDVAVKLQENAVKLSPELALWMRVEGYGKVLSREGLDVKTRELINVSVLVVKDRPRQLYSHLRGALRVGASKAEIRGLISKMFEMNIIEDQVKALELLEEIKL